jgi:hypothetical protein
MNRTLTIATVLIMFFALPFLANAKSNTKTYRGYVVTNSGEKLIGKIQMLSPTLNEVKVKFIGRGSTKRILKAKDVKEYSFRVKKWNKAEKQYEEVWVTYIRKKVERSPIPFGPTNVLIERQIEGPISLYNHFVEQNSNTTSPYIQIKYVERHKDMLILISQENYKKVLKSLTVNNPTIHNKIGTRGYYFNNIDKIIIEYNTWLEQNGTI